MSDYMLLLAGAILHAVTFAAGILVGTSLRKDTRHDSSNEGTTTKDSEWWHKPVSGSAEGGAERRCGSSARKKRAAHSPERAPVGRGSVWE